MDQLNAMRAFVRVIQSGGFSAAARDHNTSQATMSKQVAALEARLGVKLLTRSSRDHSLTQVGAEYYEKCLDILNELDEADSRARSQSRYPRGGLKISVPVVFGHKVIAPLMAEFITLYPDVTVDLELTDKQVDLIAEGVDVAIRAQKLEDSSLVARSLFSNPMMVCASPDYLERHGIPKKPQDLKHHQCIIFSWLKNRESWHFFYHGKEITVSVKGPIQSNNGDAILSMVLSGIGIAEVPYWLAEEYLKSGKLLQVMENYRSRSVPFNVVYPQNRFVPLKVRCFVEFIREKLSASESFI
ncbi:LysR family transcriptional regulator [Kistimonas scapharcae]|uniref:LysR family transcriptional regulator n=1 Tax=Kistimonas scapharcae TaxID=1036133 RepID=A0ABP8V754_9GAMM